ncbi:MAG: toxin-antitoxin system HicB family antitoxin [Clostridia bacterium]|nr:toxin-antitoxin system HicB family antitoxin [Bacillota bacterium]MBO2520576.1 toxin-antitoxin system HicB family antitoxin [Bacillota bacterium]
MAKKKAFLLRIDPAVHAALEKWAADELRSVNAHIEYLLRQALIKAGRLKPGGRKDPERRDGDESTPSPG